MPRSAVRGTALTLLLAMAVLSVALAVRLREIGQPLVTFRAIRHYRSAMIARDFYYHTAPGIPQQSIKVADANMLMQQAGEPPIMELLACAAYLMLGREEVAIPRVLAAAAWVLGAIPLWFLARRVGSAGGAVLACALYLFLPYGIVASRNFMPDALMTLVSLCALLALLRYHEDQTPRRRASAIALVGLALLVKPMSVFLVLPPLIGLHVARHPLRGARHPLRRAAIAEHRDLVIMLALAFVPSALYYGYGAIVGNLVRDQMQTRFVPHLLVTTFFWGGLLTQAQRVFTLPVLAIGWLGVALAPRGTASQGGRPGRTLLASLWIGYAAFAVAFTYHMPTHDYYHWPYLAVVALGAAIVVTRAEQWLAAPRAAAAVVVAVVSIAIAVAGTRAAWPRLQVRDASAQLERYREIGDLAEHDTRVLFLDSEYGYPLMYHSEVSGDAWPGQDDLAAESLAGRPAIDAEARFARDYADFAPRFFIVTDLDSLDAQPDLQKLLAERTVMVRRAPKYHVYRFNETATSRATP